MEGLNLSVYDTLMLNEDYVEMMVKYISCTIFPKVNM